ncbi:MULTISPECIES: BTAD domain-containing putative transcriptional regulator [unclassified Micromonospora]|uniref:BTAD domain-containing putative transcriptional regulator n=1 Tax=unclassified Micromonospora TaxID=2617518 RepID=UPI0027DD8982|nr:MULTISPECIES: BTAD domain-containing putative transcriptional regulator [unclassified Micromonospora]
MSVSRQPLRERAQCLLTRVLVAGGALAVYRAAREALTDELGVPPGAEMEHLPAAAALVRRRLPRLRPRRGHNSETHSQAQPAAAHSAGLRRPEGNCRSLIARREEQSGSGPTIRLVDGTAGCGRTTLALHVASRLAERLPGGQLFVDLRAHRGHVEDA